PDALAGEHQVGGNLVFGEADLGELVVTHEAGRVAVQTVIDEQLGAMLQRGRIHADRRAVQINRGGGAEGQRRREERSRHEPLEGLDHADSHLKVTLSGSGLHLSILVYHGIRMKNAKYSTEHSWAIGAPGMTPKKAYSGGFTPRKPRITKQITKITSALL